MFPEFFDSPLQVSMLYKAQRDGIVQFDLINLRDFGIGTHKSLDDSPFGGGPGMIMRIEPIHAALEQVGEGHRVLLSATGRLLDQPTLQRLATLDHLVLVCGRYEGVDERVAEHLVDEEISLGDYVLLGGETAAMAIIEGVTRLLPGVLGNEQSVRNESFQDGLLEEPQYTRPADYEGWQVPEVLLSGDHGRIADWRQAQRRDRTRIRRPDLWKRLAMREDRG
jgi:tRNA (guanine37-N1)-methyltransferase